jgi:hypothetical protein
MPRQHGDLAAMMSIVRDEIADESGNIGLETLYPSVSGERRCQHLATESRGFRKRFKGIGSSSRPGF